MHEKILIAAHVRKIIFLVGFSTTSTCTGDPAGLQPPPLSAPSFGKEGKQI